MENDAYLEEGFEPTKLKVVELRNLLVRHNIDYNSGAKKAELVDLFNTHILPKAPALRAKAKAVKPDSRGILLQSPAVSTPRRGRPPKQAAPVSEKAGSLSNRKVLDPSDIESASESEKDKKGKLNFSDENPFQNSPTPSKTKTKSVKRANMATSELDSPVPLKKPSVSNPAATTSSPTPFKIPSVPNPPPKTEFSTLSKKYRGGYLSMMDTPPQFLQKQNTVPGTPPQFKKFMAPPPHTPVQSEFSNEPSTPAQPVSPTQTPASKVAAFPSTATPPKLPSTPISKKPSSSPEARRRRLRDTGSEDANANTATGDEENTMEYSRRYPQIHIEDRKSSFSTFRLLLFCLVLFFAWYRWRMLEKGYCDEGDPAAGESPDLENEPFSFLTPRCHPCPPHGHCEDRRLVSCDPEFVKQPYFKSPFDFLSTNPLFSPIFPFRCKPDTETKRKVAILVDVVGDILSERAGTVDCQGLKAVGDETFLSSDTELEMSKLSAKERRKLMGLTVAQLRDKLYELKDPSIPDARFDDLWRLTVRDLKSSKDDFDVISSDRDDEEEYIVSRNPKYPFVCLFRKKAMKLLTAYKLPLIGFFFGTTILGWFKRKWRVRQTESRQVTELVEIVLGKLQEQEHNHYVDPVSFPMMELSVAQLRDFLLSGEMWTDAKSRESVWKKVQKQIERNSNVRSRVAEVKGEPHRVWEWIGGAGLTGSRLPQTQLESLYPSVS